MLGVRAVVLSGAFGVVVGFVVVFVLGLVFFANFFLLSR